MVKFCCAAGYSGICYVLTLPEGEVAKFYYESKLNVFNFTIFDLGEKKGYCYLWHEGIARRGANEISTGVYLFLNDVNNNKKEVIFYTDNCIAQNKKKFLFSMYLYCVENLEISSITYQTQIKILMKNRMTNKILFVFFFSFFMIK